MMALGFLLGIVVGILYFEVYSVKRLRTREDAQTVLDHCPMPVPVLDCSEQAQTPEQWKQ